MDEKEREAPTTARHGLLYAVRFTCFVFGPTSAASRFELAFCWLSALALVLPFAAVLWALALWLCVCCNAA